MFYFPVLQKNNASTKCREVDECKITNFKIFEMKIKHNIWEDLQNITALDVATRVGYEADQSNENK